MEKKAGETERQAQSSRLHEVEGIAKKLEEQTKLFEIRRQKQDDKYEDLQIQYDKLRDTERVNKQALSDHRRELETMKSEFSHLTIKTSTLLEEKEREIEALTSENAAIFEKLEDSQEEMSMTVEQYHELNERMSSNVSSIASLKSEVSRLMDLVTQKDEIIGTLKMALTTASVESTPREQTLSERYLIPNAYIDSELGSQCQSVCSRKQDYEVKKLMKSPRMANKRRRKSQQKSSRVPGFSRGVSPMLIESRQGVRDTPDESCATIKPSLTWEGEQMTRTLSAPRVKRTPNRAPLREISQPQMMGTTRMEGYKSLLTFGQPSLEPREKTKVDKQRLLHDISELDGEIYQIQKNLMTAIAKASKS